MATVITVVCPKCQKSIQAPDTVAGRTIKCKACQTAFVASAQQAPAKASAKAEAKPDPKAEAKKKADDEEWGVVKAYGMTIEKEKARCPFCAWELEEEDDVICLHCGYNLQTRERLQPRAIEPNTGWDYFKWWFWPVVCLLIALNCIADIVVIWVWWELDFGYPWTEAVKVYCSVVGIVICWFTGKFALKRMIFHPHPPEREKLLDGGIQQEGEHKPVRRRRDDDDDDDDDDDYEDDDDDDEDD